MSHDTEQGNTSPTPTPPNREAAPSQSWQSGLPAFKRSGDGLVAAPSTKSEEITNESSTVPPATGTQISDQPSTISSAKQEANRRNSQRSTGPKTENGKARSRCNAMKHGILSSALLIRSGYGAEDAQEFELFYADLVEDLDPIGILEEMQVERVSICWWRQKRVLQAEAGRISKAFAEADPRFLFADLQPLSNPALATLRDHLRVPLGKELDCLLRYESSIQRQLNNALNQLERLQRSRKGEHVPPPVTVEVSSAE